MTLGTDGSVFLERGVLLFYFFVVVVFKQLAHSDFSLFHEGMRRLGK